MNQDKANILFIGGPVDGKVYTVGNHQDRYAVQTIAPTPIDVDDLEDEPTPIEYHIYRREHIGTATAVYSVFIYGPMTVDDALQLLLTHYPGTEYAVMPLELTAENGAKGALIGEFHELCEVANEWHDPDDEDSVPSHTVQVPVRWTTIKAIYRRCVALLAKRRN